MSQDSIDPQGTAGHSWTEQDVDPATWNWLFGDEAGVAMAGPVAPEVVFHSQGSAEDWLAEQFQQLSDSGIATATLLDGEHVVYGPMRLTPDA